jgi:sugar phosphate isomerase/epimerase
MTQLPIAVQLYSLREAAAMDFPAVLKRIGSCGFVGVELAGFHGLTANEFARYASDADLVVSSAHVGDIAADALHLSLDDLETVGCSTAILAFVPPDAFSSKDGVSRIAESINAANEIARARGFTFGYHNHWWEFENTFNGRTAWDHLFDRLDPTVVAELDIYWATVGGANPADVIGGLGDRLRLVHVKDGPADSPKSPMVAVGSGLIDIPGILGVASTARWHIVELDRCSTDMMTAVEDSYRYLVGSSLSQGRK